MSTMISSETGGLVHVSGGVKPWHVDTGRHTAAPILLSESSAPVFVNQDAIAQRSSPGLASNRATATCMRCKPHQGANRPSVTIRPPIPTPVQRVTRISAETDDLAKSGSAKLPGHCLFTRETGGLSMLGRGSKSPRAASQQVRTARARGANRSVLPATAPRK